MKRLSRGLAVGLVVVTCLGALEMLFRMAIYLNLSAFRDPGLYADWTADDDYWKLRHLWQKRVTSPSPEVLDPILGWSPNRTSANPLGVVGVHPQQIQYDQPTVLFYGDSFVQGKGPWKERLPAKTQAALGTLPVYNLGVRGYGLDQIVLKFQQTHHHFKKPVLVFGILTVDLDRSLLKFRTGQKPQFVSRQGELTLAGLPIASSPERWLGSNPPSIRSYFLAFLRRRWQQRGARNELEVAYRREDKEKLNRQILDLVRSEANSRQLPLLVVLFYNQVELDYVGWRETFLKQYLDQQGMAYIDSKEILLQAIAQTHREAKQWYDVEGHLNAGGNELVGKAIAENLRKRGLVASSSPALAPDGTEATASPSAAGSSASGWRNNPSPE